VRDQGGLCAYCQRRITLDDDPSTRLPQMKIEHWRARSDPETRPFGWSDLLGVCRGISSDSSGAPAPRQTEHCDTSRGDRKLFLHPVEGRGPDPREHLRYAKDGTASAAIPDPRVDDDLSALNLNARSLVRARGVVLDEAWKRLKHSGFAIRDLRKLEQQLRIEPGCQAPVYAEFLLYHVQKKLRSLGQRT
jgi:uncharacterized protein (TIGR02646 family)